jgi:hypothetical protein
VYIEGNRAFLATSRSVVHMSCSVSAERGWDLYVETHGISGKLMFCKLLMIVRPLFLGYSMTACSAHQSARSDP